MRIRGGAASWIAVLTASAFLNGCFAHHPVMEPAPPPPGTAPDGSPLTGTYDDGLRDGEAAAEAKTVAGYVVLGAITAPLIVLCIVAAAGGGGGGGNVGSCGGGGSGGGTSTRVVPMDAGYRTDAYLSGYHEGYHNRLDQRQENAFLGGFLAGLLITGGILAFLYFDDAQRDRTEDELGNHATAAPRRGAPLLEF